MTSKSSTKIIKRSKRDVMSVEASSSSKKTTTAIPKGALMQKRSVKKSSNQGKICIINTTTEALELQLKWANHFPELNYKPTDDERIFQTEWETQGSGMQIIKKKTIFACILGEAGDCYGIDVLKEWAVDSRENEATAIEKVKFAITYRETHGAWPQTQTNEEDPS